MNYVTFLPARGVGTAVPEPSWKASAGLEAHAANTPCVLAFETAWEIGKDYVGCSR